MPLIPITTPFNVDIEFEGAEFYKRFFAYAIDASLLLIYFMCMNYVFGLNYFFFDGIQFSDKEKGLELIALLIPTLSYTLLTELWFNGQTLGKKIFRIKVISLDGGEPSLEQYLLRWFLRFYEWGALMILLFRNSGPGAIVLFLIAGIISVIIILITPKNQRLGDIVAGTVVVNANSRLTVNDTIFMNISEKDYKVKFQNVLRLSDRDINTIKHVLSLAQKSHKYDMVNKVAAKVREVLKISDGMYSLDFLEKILEDYNYLATRE
jgi:uncharacterized RDD family membrane protein YckC